MILLCGLLALPVALVNAYNPAYTNTNYAAWDEVVVDGAYTAGSWTFLHEWDDSETPPYLNNETFNWRQKWTQPSDIIQHFLIESVNDTTSDAGDYAEFCIDLDADGGAAPQANDFRLHYTGDGTLTVYEGDGSGWVEYTDYTMPDDIEIADSMGSSPFNAAAHWIVELNINKNTKFDISGSGYQPWIRLAVYDSSNASGVAMAWPIGSSADVPDEWGLEMGTTEQIVPEALTVAVVVLLSSVAVVVSFYCLRRRPKTESSSVEKTGAQSYMY